MVKTQLDAAFRSTHFLNALNTLGLGQWLLATLALLLCLWAPAQTELAPSVAWKKDQHFPHFPEDSGAATVWISSDQYSGEDSWQSVEKVYSPSGAHTGYIAVGYSKFENYEEGDTSLTYPEPWLYDEVSGGQGGVVQGTPGISCLSFYTNPMPPYDTNWSGTQMQTVGYYDLDGNMIWCRVYNEGNFQNVVQSNDRLSFVCVGITKAIKDRKAYEWTNPGGQFISYNPSTSSATNTFQGWSGNGLSSSLREGNVSAVCIDTNGVVQWNYLYGNQAFGANGINAWKNQGIAFAVCAGPGTGSSQSYRVVGRTNTMDGSGTIICDRSWFSLDISSTGYVNWHHSPYVGLGNIRTVALDVARNATGAGEYYVTGYRSLYTGNTTLSNQNTAIALHCYGPSTTTTNWDTVIDNTIDNYSGGFVTTGSLHACAGWSLDFDYEGNLLLGALINGSWNPQTVEGSYANPRVYTIAPNTGAFGGLVRTPLPSSANFVKVGTHELRLSITATADSGFALASCRQKATPWTAATFPSAFPWAALPTTCNLSSELKVAYWDSDALVSKFKDNGAGEWELKWETTFDSDNTRQNYPGDLKKRECVFALVEAADGGLVIGGITSDNHDDTYLVKLEDDCGDEIAVQFNASPFCFGDTSALLTVWASGGSEPYTYTWSNSAINDTVAVNAAGTYTVTVTDSLGCKISDTFAIVNPAPLLVSISASNDSIGIGDTLTVIAMASGGSPPYSYQWWNGSNNPSQDVVITADTSLFVTATDSLGCTGTGSILIFAFDSTLNLNYTSVLALHCTAYPNPASERVHFTIPSAVQVRVFDATGKLISSGLYAEGTHTLEVAQWSAGIYLFRFDSPLVRHSERVMVE